MSQATRSVPPRSPPRQRRSAADARQTILAAAERRLIADGPAAIRVQTLARDLGLTDAAIHYHFASQAGLVEALLRHAGRGLRDQLAAAIQRWDRVSFDIRTLIDLVAETYARRGYARLAAWMVLAGWKPHGAGLFRETAEVIHARRVKAASARARRPPPLEDTLETVALINLVLFAEALAGGAFRRSVGLPDDRQSARRFRNWLARLLESHLDAAVSRRPTRPRRARGAGS